MVIRVSRHGMTRCTSCDRHIRIEAVVAETRCPFCGRTRGLYNLTLQEYEPSLRWQRTERLWRQR